jgi:peptidoglycan hydrolase-like protein with peptidoglycan-binding domain
MAFGRTVMAVAGGAVLALALASPAGAHHPSVAAVQVALRAVHLYPGAIDGIAGPQTRGAIRAFQRRKRLGVDGIVGPQTRRALGRRGRPPLGSRAMRRGHRGWDVVGLQYLLRARGFSAGAIDGGFGAMTDSAVRRFQRSAGIGVDGVAGPNTLRGLRRSQRTGNTIGGPVAFLRPVRGPIGDGFGWVSGRRHTGLDFPVRYGTPIGAAGRGVVRFAGWNSGGYGNLIVIGHRLGFESWYAHLSRIAARPGQAVVGGTRIGYVGSTGRSTGPHLHFEVRHAGIPINPVPRLLSAVAASRRRGRCLEGGSPDRRRGQRRPSARSDDPAVALQARCR